MAQEYEDDSGILLVLTEAGRLFMEHLQAEQRGQGSQEESKPVLEVMFRLNRPEFNPVLQESEKIKIWRHGAMNEEKSQSEFGCRIMLFVCGNCNAWLIIKLHNIENLTDEEVTGWSTAIIQKHQQRHQTTCWV
jgi:hypothetical protein